MFDEMLFESYEGDLLDLIQTEDAINEVSLLKPLPKELKLVQDDLKKYTKEYADTHFAKYKDRVLHPFKNMITENDIMQMIKYSTNKSGLKLHSVKTVTYNYNGAVSESYHALCIYKKYILTLVYSNAWFGTVSVEYNEDDCDIPKNVIVDVLQVFGDNVSRLSTKKKGITIHPIYPNTKDIYAKLLNKYDGKYIIKRNAVTDNIKISVIEK